MAFSQLLAIQLTKKNKPIILRNRLQIAELILSVVIN